MTTGQLGTLVHSYLALRWIIGVLAITLPLVLVIWEFISCECDDILSSISNYYHSDAGDYFVGIVFAIAVFLFTYRGYAKGKEWISDNYAGYLTCLFLLGVALFPTGDSWIGQAHLTFATLAFLMLAYFCFVLFVKTNVQPGEVLPKLKRRRNMVYRICGAIIVLCIVLIGAYLWFLQDEESISDLSPVFWLEWLALWAFGISWFVKGKALRMLKL